MSLPDATPRRRGYSLTTAVVAQTAREVLGGGAITDIAMRQGLAVSTAYHIAQGNHGLLDPQLAQELQQHYRTVHSQKKVLSRPARARCRLTPEAIEQFCKMITQHRMTIEAAALETGISYSAGKKLVAGTYKNVSADMVRAMQSRTLESRSSMALLRRQVAQLKAENAELRAALETSLNMNQRVLELDAAGA